MFDKLKQLNEIRAMQQAIKQKRTEAEMQGVTVAMRGDFEIESIRLNPDLDIKTQEKVLMRCINEAKEKMQKILAKDLAGKFF